MHVVVLQILFLQGLSGFVKFRPVLPSLAAHLILTIFLLINIGRHEGMIFFYTFHLLGLKSCV